MRGRGREGIAGFQGDAVGEEGLPAFSLWATLGLLATDWALARRTACGILGANALSVCVCVWVFRRLLPL